MSARHERILIIVCLLVVAIACLMPSTRPDEGEVLAPVPDRFFTDAVECPPRGLVMDGHVDRVIDGDTIIVSTVVTYRIRLLDCWAPESRTRDLAEKQRGLQASARMEELAGNQPVRVFIPAMEGDLSKLMSLGRVLGRAWVMDAAGVPAVNDLSTIMVREGHATATRPEETP